MVSKLCTRINNVKTKLGRVIFVCSQALLDASRMKEMRSILAIAWLGFSWIHIFDGWTVGAHDRFFIWSTSSKDGWRFVYTKTCCVHYLNRKLVDSPRMWKLCHLDELLKDPPWHGCQNPPYLLTDSLAVAMVTCTGLLLLKDIVSSYCEASLALRYSKTPTCCLREMNGGCSFLLFLTLD